MLICSKISKGTHLVLTRRNDDEQGFIEWRPDCLASLLRTLPSFPSAFNRAGGGWWVGGSELHLCPPPAPNLVHLNSDLILPDGSHPVPWVLALSEMHPELTAASRPFLQLDSFTKTVFLSLHLLKENFIHHPTLRFPRTIPVLSNEYFSTSCFLRHSLVLLLRM